MLVFLYRVLEVVSKRQFLLVIHERVVYIVLLGFRELLMSQPNI